jgi:hypothetical protein
VGGNATGFSSLSPVAVPLWADPRLDTGMDIRDQVAIAVDEWLTSEGY